MVLFDSDKIIDCAGYAGIGDPNAPPVGIKFVIVNGEIVCEDNVVDSSKRSGTLLKY